MEMIVARGIILGALLLSVAPNAFAQAPTASCIFLANVTTCRIDYPLVTRGMTEYDGAFHPEIFLSSSNNKSDNNFGVILPDIPLQFGDAVTVVDAGGCVQRGGDDSKNWIRYVEGGYNGQGNVIANNSYHGTLGVINATFADGVMSNPVRIKDIIGRPFWIPAAQKLRLGYEDDGFSDNGYWGHSGGDPVQCSHGTSGPAFVTVRIDRNVPPPNLPLLKPWDVASGDFDTNGLMLNPVWGWQTLLPSPSSPYDFNDCQAPLAECTSVPVTFDAPDDPGDVLPSYKDYLSSCAQGHINWTVVSYEGQITFSNHDKIVDAKLPPFGDDDYNFDLVRWTPIVRQPEPCFKV
jgi:hypothetical protein